GPERRARRRTVLACGPLRARHELSSRRTTVAVIGTAVAKAVASADGARLSAGGAEPAARARRVVGADGTAVAAAHAVILRTGSRPASSAAGVGHTGRRALGVVGCLWEEVERQVDVRVQREVQIHRAGAALRGTHRRLRNLVDDADGSPRDDGQWRTEQTPGVRAVPIAAGVTGRRSGERQGLPAAAAHLRARIAGVRDGRGWHGRAAAASVEVVATKHLDRCAAVVDRAPAVPGPEGRREAQEGWGGGAAFAYVLLRARVLRVRRAGGEGDERDGAESQRT